MRPAKADTRMREKRLNDIEILLSLIDSRGCKANLFVTYFFHMVDVAFHQGERKFERR